MLWVLILVMLLSTVGNGLASAHLRQKSMSYPGQNSRVGMCLEIGGDLIIFKTLSDDTAGLYSIFEVVALPTPAIAPLHRHPAQETFYVMDGEFEFATIEVGRRLSMIARRGSTVHMRSMMPHAYRNVGTRVGRLIVVCQPGAQMERFFEELGVPCADETFANPSQTESAQTVQTIAFERLQVIGRKYDVECVEFE